MPQGTGKKVVTAPEHYYFVDENNYFFYDCLLPAGLCWSVPREWFTGFRSSDGTFFSLCPPEVNEVSSRYL